MNPLTDVEAVKLFPSLQHLILLRDAGWKFMADLIEVWEEALELRRAMSPGSPVVALDKLLRAA